MKNLQAYGITALDLAQPSIEQAIRCNEGRNALHVIMLDPRCPYKNDTKLPILLNQTFGERDSKKWSRDFTHIAYLKAEVCWRTGLSSRTVGENAPYLYEPGDTKFPGGVVCNGLIVAASGLDWQLDEACAHMVIAFFWAQMRMARDKVMADPETILISQK